MSAVIEMNIFGLTWVKRQIKKVALFFKKGKFFPLGYPWLY